MLNALEDLVNGCVSVVSQTTVAHTDDHETFFRLIWDKTVKRFDVDEVLGFRGLEQSKAVELPFRAAVQSHALVFAFYLR